MKDPKTFNILKLIGSLNKITNRILEDTWDLVKKL